MDMELTEDSHFFIEAEQCLPANAQANVAAPLTKVHK